MQMCNSRHEVIAGPVFYFLKEQTVPLFGAQLHKDLKLGFHFSSGVWSLQRPADKYLLCIALMLPQRAEAKTKRTQAPPLTLMPSMRKPRVAVELSVSLHCMYLGLRMPCWARSSSVGAPGSTATILSYMSFRKRGRSRAFFSSSSKYVLENGESQCYFTKLGFIS